MTVASGSAVPVWDGQLSGTTQLEGEEESLTVQAMLLNQDGCRNPHWLGVVFEDSPGENTCQGRLGRGD